MTVLRDSAQARADAVTTATDGQEKYHEVNFPMPDESRPLFEIYPY